MRKYHVFFGFKRDLALLLLILVLVLAWPLFMNDACGFTFQQYTFKLEKTDADEIIYRISYTSPTGKTGIYEKRAGVGQEVYESFGKGWIYQIQVIPVKDGIEGAPLAEYTIKPKGKTSSADITF